MNPSDVQICQHIVNALSSKKYEKDCNYLFFEPVDLTHFPTYTSIVARPMDLGTVKTNLKKNVKNANVVYKKIDDCLNDISTCFENAELFHQDKDETKWIIGFAKKMKKNMRKEMKAAKKKFGSGSSASNNSSSGGGDTSGGAAGGNAAAAAAAAGGSSKSTSSPAAPSNGDGITTSSSGSGSGKSSKAKKLSLSIKGGAAGRSSNKLPSSSSGNATTPSETKKKKKLSLSSSNKQSTSSSTGTSTSTSTNVPTTTDSTGASTTTTSTSTSTTPRPKLSIKLNAKGSSATASSSSSSSSATPMSQNTNTPTTTSRTATPTTTSTTTKPKLKLRINSKKTASNKSTSKKMTPTTKSPKLSRSPVPTMQQSSSSSSSSSLPPDKSTTPAATGTAATLTASDSNKTKSNNNTSSGNSSSSTTTANNTTTTASTTTSSTTSTSTTSNTTKSTKSKKPTSTPKSTPSAPSRGKELPSAIAAAKANAKKESSSSSKKESNSNSSNNNNNNNSNSNNNNKSVSPTTIASTPSSSSSTTTTTKTTSTNKSSSTAKKESRKTNRTPKGAKTTGAMAMAMTPKYKAQCYKVLSALKHREENVLWFIKSVKIQFKAVVHYDDYTQKVPFPMDIGTMNNKLDKNNYASVADFTQDLRRIYANCLRYNVISSDPRQLAREMLISSEQYLHLFLIKNLNSSSSPSSSSSSSSSSSKAFPKLLYCWKMCLEILDAVVGLKNTDDKQQTAHYFLHPASFYFNGKLPQEYTDKVKNPMDFGTITSNLIEGVYQSVEAFVKDCKLVTSNCKAYHEDPEAIYVVQANRLEEFLSPRLESLLQYDKSSKGVEGRKMASPPAALTLLKPPNVFYTSMLDELRSANYTDKSTKLTEKATLQFEHSVDISSFKDYLQFVETPMDLKTVENNASNGLYQYPEDFEYDVNLIFKNCEAYNIPKQNVHIVNLSKHCARIFRKMYSLRIKAYEASGGKSLYGDEKKTKRRSSDMSVTSAPPAKKMKTESTAAKRKSPTPQLANNQSIARGKSPKNQGKKTVPRLVIRTDGPVPLHVAIAKIKQSFTCRRQHKELQDWEGGCSRFFREFKKHPWASSSKRFVFDAPVPMLHPEIKEAYKIQIKNPMDLTTAEGKLLQGGIYKEPQEFIDDVALVFANAVTFNRIGNEQGDPTSMAYFDASKHLLRYTRWLSLEYLSAYLADDSHSEGIRQSGALKHWKLTKSNQSDARFEMENIVLQQTIDRSDEGDRFTWQESECEKLLRSLRHQTDHKRMAYFIRPNFPPDYVAIISKPICWEDCCKKLQKRKYETFGEVISDLRLIFTNALKYNGRVKHLDITSQQAYDSAVIMAGKLEVAIQRLYITVADRIEREKVEEVILDREAEDLQKAEEERLRTELQKERERTRRAGGQSMSNSSIQSVKIIQRRAARRDLDFDNPFDQDNSFEQSEMETQNKQKNMYERQQRDRIDMLRVSRNVGIRVFHNLFWRSQAIYWAKDMSFQIQQNLSQNRSLQPGAEKIEKENQNENVPKPSLVSSLLGTSSRSQVKMSLARPKQNKKKRKRLFLDL